MTATIGFAILLTFNGSNVCLRITTRLRLSPWLVTVDCFACNLLCRAVMRTTRTTGCGTCRLRRGSPQCDILRYRILPTLHSYERAPVLSTVAIAVNVFTVVVTTIHSLPGRTTTYSALAMFMRGPFSRLLCQRNDTTAVGRRYIGSHLCYPLDSLYRQPRSRGVVLTRRSFSRQWLNTV